jgi:hypothetical protein
VHLNASPGGEGGGGGGLAVVVAAGVLVVEVIEVAAEAGHGVLVVHAGAGGDLGSSKGSTNRKRSSSKSSGSKGSSGSSSGSGSSSTTVVAAAAAARRRRRSSSSKKDQRPPIPPLRNARAPELRVFFCGDVYTARACAQPPPPPPWDRALGSNGPSGPRTPSRPKLRSASRSPSQPMPLPGLHCGARLTQLTPRCLHMHSARQRQPAKQSTPSTKPTARDRPAPPRMPAGCGARDRRGRQMSNPHAGLPSGATCGAAETAEGASLWLYTAPRGSPLRKEESRSQG